MIHPLRFHRHLTLDHAAALLVTLAPLVYFLPAVSGTLVLCPDDGVTFNLPLRVAATRILFDGQLPLWNPYLFGGMPLLGAAQAGLLFPLNWFFLLFQAPLAMNLAVLSTYAIAGLGAYFYARRTGANITGALVTGFVWQLGGFLVAQLGHTNIIQTASLLPWLLWSIDRYGATHRRSHGLTVALIVALQTFAGHQQTLVYALLLAAAYALSMWRGERNDERGLAETKAAPGKISEDHQSAPQSRRSQRRLTRSSAYIWSLLMIAIGLMLAAVQILPALELMRNSVRAQATFEFFSSFSLPPVFSLTYFAPYLVGGGDGRLFRAPYTGPSFYAEYIGYVGLATLALAVMAPVLKRDARTKFWTMAALVCFALALGRFLPFDLYRLIYYVPVLNLFRVPARHLMEVDFALAVLAGRAVTALAAKQGRARPLLTVLVAAGLVFLLTCLTVSVWRPHDFKLGRPALEITILRAPELFLPIVIAAVSAWALWRLACGRRASGAWLVGIIVLDLSLWGQFSGWSWSPRRDHPLWQTPPAVRILRDREKEGAGRYRVLTMATPFYPDAAFVAEKNEATPFVLSVQPNTYMLHGIENAAGYDGFGMARYSRLAGNMKLWGEVEEPERSLRESRAFDLLNVRYLIVPRPGAEPTEVAPPRAMQKIGNFWFDEKDLAVPYLDAGARIEFITPRTTATRIALLTNLSWSTKIPDGATVGRLRMTTDDGRVFEFPLRAGVDTAEWAHERDRARGLIKHQLATVGTSYKVEDAEGVYEGHAYITSFPLPEKVSLAGGSIEVAADPRAEKLGLSVMRISLIDESRDGEAHAVVPLRRQWLTKVLPATDDGDQHTPVSSSPSPLTVKGAGSHWQRISEAGEAWLYENRRALPRAWLATKLVTQTDEATLEVIKTGKFADGRVWEPQRTALLEVNLTDKFDGGETDAQVEITKYEANCIEMKTTAQGPTILVLSENHYPGWRALVDGRAVETLRVNYNLRGVALSPGAHTVRFVYRPKSVYIGVLISLLAATGLLLWWRHLLPEARTRLRLGRLTLR